MSEDFPKLNDRTDDNMADNNKAYILEFVKICKKYGVPIVEVGSGDGRIAHWLMKNKYLKDEDLIGIDPDPMSFSKDKKLYFDPKYKYCKDLVVDNPKIVGQCGLLLIRPNPTLEYDIESLQLLKPLTVMIIYRSDGADGCIEFHRYLKELNSPSSIDCDPMPDIQLVSKFTERKELRFDYISVFAKYTKEIEIIEKLSIRTCLLLIPPDYKEYMYLPQGELNNDAPSVDKCKQLIAESQVAVFRMIHNRFPK
jgi:hypothetical protein